MRRHLAGEPQAVALESGPGYGDLGRWSIFAWKPLGEFTVRGNRWDLSIDERVSAGPVPSGQSALEALRELLRHTRKSREVESANQSSLPFQGGWIGFVGYDFAPQLERLPRRHSPAVLPDMHWMYFPRACIIDRREGAIHYVVDPRFEDSYRIQDKAGPWEFEKRLQLMENSVLTNTPPTLKPPRSDWTKDEFKTAVERAIEYIRAGDVFQVNLAHQFTATLHKAWLRRGHLAHLWDRCVTQSPAPFSAMIKTPEWSVLSTSPERFLLVEPDGRVETRPIKGTRPRGKTAKEDAAMMSALLASAKDRAELAMIVDLERNDLGRVCEFGSVKVAQHAALESYSNVHHLVSTVEGKLRPRMDVVDLLAAAFPGGSITGAPKIRAMEIIDELEACSRGIYTGAIGYISDHGRADFNIAIRTLVVEGDQAHYHVGGGITEGSDPEAEYEETLAKGSKLMRVLTENP